jgi:hypothetical protein
MPPAIPDAGQHDHASADAPVCRTIQEHLWGIVLAGGEGRRLQQRAYATLASVNFSEAILAPNPHRLGVIRVSGIYWSDWGDTARIQHDRARFGLQPPEFHRY